MNKLVLFILLLVSFKLVFVASQSCTKSENCEEVGNCCRDGFCTTECDDFCYKNSECDSGCCKDSKCQDTYETCSQTDNYATTAPDLLNSCHYDRGDYGECCVKGECRSCYQIITLPSRGYPFEVNYEGKMELEVTRLSIDFVLVAVAVAIAACVMCVCCHRIKRCIDMRGRARDARAPLYQNDELQSEHERAEQGIPARLPPKYIPRPFQNTNGRPAVELRPPYTQLPEST